MDRYTKFKKYKNNYPHKVRARQLARKAVKTGEIIKPDYCEICFQKYDKRYIQGHHTDYAKPLEVIWCCIKCHNGLHKEHKERGENHHNARLKEDDILNILSMSASGGTPRELSNLFGVNIWHIYDIISGKKWKHL